jgi:nucleoside-diphosphate-sugar epimerase
MTHPLANDLDEVLQRTKDLWEPLRGSSLFVTGGTGFVGTWLNETLCWADSELNLGIRIVLLTRDPDAFRRKAPAVADHSGVEFIVGDATSFDFPTGKFKYVIHAATESSKAATPEHPDATFATAVAATKRVLEFAAQASTERFMFTSSGAVYGTQPLDLAAMSEDYPGAPSPMDAKSAYGQAKRASEFLCAMYARQYGFDALIARLFAFVGPYLPLDNFAVGNFIKNVRDGKAIRIESDGSTARSYLYGADMAVWLWTILLRGQSFRPYNVGGSTPISIRQLAEKVAAVAGNDTSVEVLGLPGVPATRYIPDTLRARTELQLKEHVRLEEALKRTLSWHRAQTPELKHG